MQNQTYPFSSYPVRNNNKKLKMLLSFFYTHKPPKMCFVIYTQKQGDVYLPSHILMALKKCLDLKFMSLPTGSFPSSCSSGLFIIYDQ